MTESTTKASDKAAIKGTGFLFWGWVAVTTLNLGMIIGSLALFAP